MSKTRVVVLMSGGVDSSVAAAFLKQKGYEVVGITMERWGHENRNDSSTDVHDARMVANKLNIPHYVFDLGGSFRKHVIDYFVSEYIQGRTPNPCAVCNPTIKFGEFLQKTTELGAQYLATGHYAIVSYNKDKGRYVLKRGKERGKDQSYFLARLSQEALRRTLFPVGSFPKYKIRTLAQQFGLAVAQKSESQEACFISEEGVVEFIKRQESRSFPSGPILDKKGNCLGTHNGIIGYTIGQRKGLGISVGRPVYVTAINSEHNTITIGEDQDLYHSVFIAKEPHWISISGLKESLRCCVRIRYKHKASEAEIIPLGGNKVKVCFDRPQRAITPGQLAVFYDSDIVLGSAWIDCIIRT